MQTKSYLTRLLGCVLLVLLGSLTSCEDVLEQYFPKPTPTPPPTIPTFPPLGQDIAFYALSGGNRLDAYNTSNAATRTSSVALTGLGSGETLLAIDFRPATGQLYGVSSASRLYVINQNTGAARAIGTGPFTPAVGGNLVGFDFNPTVDRIRLVTSTGQNLRLNPETGTVAATDGVLNGAPGATITGAAYTNNTTNAETTVLYDLDPATDKLYRQDPPNDGTLVAVGTLNLDISGNGGFDIDAKTGTALGLYPVNGNPTLFAVDLGTGNARPLAQYAANSAYTALAIPTKPVLYAAGYILISGRGTGNYLYTFDPTDTSSPTAVNTQPILLGRNQAVQALDFRPATGQLYALVIGQGGRYLDGTVFTGSTRLYTIDLITARATLVADLSMPLTPSINNNFPVNFDADFFGDYGFDFDPVTDRIRIVVNNSGRNVLGRNVVVNPTDGTVTVESNLNPNVPISDIAYDNSFAGATSTTLYAIGGNKLYRSPSPSAGTLTEVGTISGNGGSSRLFDIGATSNTAYALGNNGVTSLNLATQTATFLRALTIPGGPIIYALAVAPGF